MQFVNALSCDGDSDFLQALSNVLRQHLRPEICKENSQERAERAASVGKRTDRERAGGAEAPVRW